MTKQEKHPDRLITVLLAVFIVITPACIVPFRPSISTAPPATQPVPGPPSLPTFTPTVELIAPLEQFAHSMQTRNNLTVGLPTIVDVNSPNNGAKKQVAFFRQVLDTISKGKKINVITEKANYALRALLAGEVIQNIVVAQYVDNLTTAFFVSTEQNGAHTYLIDPRGSAFELYLFAQNSAGRTFFESDPSKVQPILDMPDLQTVQWVTVRLLTQQDKQTLSEEAWTALQEQYAEMNKGANLDDALTNGPTWMTVPVIAWNAQNGLQTIYINPSSFDIHIEHNLAYLSGKPERGITLLLPLGKIPTEMQSQADLVSETSVPKVDPTEKPGKKGDTPGVVPTKNNPLQENINAFQNSDGVISTEKLFRGSHGINPLGVTDLREAGLTEAGSIQGDFLEFYRRASDPLLVFGYPITDEFTDPKTGLITQYFQRARFELVSTNNGPIVQLAPLGHSLHTGDAPTASIPITSSGCRYFQETNKKVCYAFMQFYDGNNGPAFFGNPISDVEIRDGRYVQYFDRARMEWQPDNPTDQHVALTDLGTIEFYARDIHPFTQKDLTIKLPNPTQRTTSLKVYAFVEAALLPAYNQQTIHIIVQDQNLDPVQAANINVKVYHPGRAEPQLLTPFITTEFGLTSEKFSIDNIPVKELVRIDITASYQDLIASTSTWFRVWW